VAARALIPADAYERRPPEPPQMPADEALEWCDLAVERYGGGLLVDVPPWGDPTECDVETRAEFRRCQQCGSRTRRLWFYRERLLLCRRCAEARVRAGQVLARPPWHPGRPPNHDDTEATR
jgi:hypothetical protein